MNSRALAAEIITECLEGTGQSHLLLQEALRRHPEADARDRNLLTSLVHGTIGCALQLDAYLKPLSRVPVEKLKPYVRTVLRMGLYQLIYLDRIPASAVCNESVKLIRKRMGDGLTGYVNGVLRAAARKESWEALSGAAAFSLPEELYDYLTALYGEAATQVIGRAYLAPPVLWARVNTSRATVEEAAASLKTEGYAAEQIDGLPGCLKLERLRQTKTEGKTDSQRENQAESQAESQRESQAESRPLDALTAFRTGRIQLQDKSAQLAVLAADPKPGMKVLDLCAAPGGKSLQAADLMRDEGEVLACDISEEKIARIRDNISRSGFGCVKATVADATVFDPEKEGRFDLVIADLPCSGLGTAGRKPEIKYRVTQEKIKELAALQRQILKNAVRYARPGGKLLFSTCTLTREENTDNADWLRDACGLSPIPLALPSECFAGAETGCLQLLPEAGSGDGFFISLFMKEKNG